jgi:hypothetical protein
MKVELTLFFFAYVAAADAASLCPFMSGVGGLQTYQIRG